MSYEKTIEFNVEVRPTLAMRFLTLATVIAICIAASLLLGFLINLGGWDGSDWQTWALWIGAIILLNLPALRR